MRIWRSRLPKISMPATPGIVSTLGFTCSFTYSLASTCGRSVVIGIHMIGKPETSNLSTTGGSSSLGRSQRARATRSRTSCAARSRSWPSSNSTEIEERPWREREVSRFSPEMVLSCSSSTSVTSSSITSGLAPSRMEVTFTIGSSIFGYWSTPRRTKPSAPNTTSESVSIQVSTGRRMKMSIHAI